MLSKDVHARILDRYEAGEALPTALLRVRSMSAKGWLEARHACTATAEFYCVGFTAHCFIKYKFAVVEQDEVLVPEHTVVLIIPKYLNHALYLNSLSVGHALGNAGCECTLSA